MKNFGQFRVFVFLLFVFFELQAVASWLNKEDAKYEINFYNETVEVEKDGTFKLTVEGSVTITKEDQTQNILTRPIQYLADRSDVEIIEAYTENEGKKFKVNNENIEDRDIASEYYGFSNTKQVFVNFNNVKKNSKLYLKYVINNKKTILPSLFEDVIGFNFDGYLNERKIKIISKIPLYINLIDKEKVLEVKKYKNDTLQIIEIKNLLPLFKFINNEEYYSLGLEHFPWVLVSSFKDWNALINPVTAKYEEVAKQKLPQLFIDIANAAKNKTTLNDKINTITSMLTDKVKYMGDWRSLQGSYYPKNLETIAQLAQADCKDYAIATVAILRYLGITAHVSLIFRGDYYEEFKNILPGTFNFNHAIVQVKDGKKIKWIDPTNFKSYAEGIFPDIADRFAIVLDPSASIGQRTPKIDYAEAKFLISETIQIKNTENIERNGSIELKGYSAIPFTAAELSASKELISSEIRYQFLNTNDLIQTEIAPYDLTSRIVNDVKFSYNTLEKNRYLKTDYGNGYSLENLLKTSSYVNPFLISLIDRQSDLFLGHGFIFESKILLNKLQRSQKENKGCDIKSKWGDFSRNINDTTSGIEIYDKIHQKIALINKQELLSTEFKTLQDNLEQCFKGIVIIPSYKNI